MSMYFAKNPLELNSEMGLNNNSEYSFKNPEYFNHITGVNFIKRLVIIYHLSGRGGIFITWVGERAGERRLEDFTCVNAKFTWLPPKSSVMFLWTPFHWHLIRAVNFCQSHLYTLLVTTDSHSVPPENHVIPPKSSNIYARAHHRRQNYQREWTLSV